MKKHEKNIISTFVKILISFCFLFFVLRKIQIPVLFDTLKHSSKPILGIVFFINLFLTFILALRWRVILGVFDRKPGYWYVWKLTMIGLFFNVFLPTGAGGDVAKIYYFVRNEQEKLKLGVSVIFDRFIGASSVMLMGILSAVLFKTGISAHYISAVVIIFIVVLVAWLIIIWDQLAKVIGKCLPSNLKFFIVSFRRKPLRLKVSTFSFGFKEKVRTFYCYVRDYGMNGKIIFSSIVVSIILQIITIYVQYLIVKSLVSPDVFSHISIIIFFIFVPLIWTLTMIPSIGGLGVREFSYLFFFSRYIGKENSIALSLTIFTLAIIQSLAGGIVFLTHKDHSGRG